MICILMESLFTRIINVEKKYKYKIEKHASFNGKYASM